MKVSGWSSLLLVAAALCVGATKDDLGADTGAGLEANPLGTVQTLLESLRVKLTSAGTMETKAFRKYRDWCQLTTATLGFNIKTSLQQKAKLEAKIDVAVSDATVSANKIVTLGAAIAQGEKDLKAAKAIRTKENALFTTASAELLKSVNALARAITILRAEMKKNPALLQVDTGDFQALAQSFSTVIDAAGIVGEDKTRLVALVQRSQQEVKDHTSDQADAADADDLAFPKKPAYQSQGGGIVDVLEDLKEKAETNLFDARQAEQKAQFAYNTLESGIKAQKAADAEEKKQEETAKSTAEKDKASAKKDLGVLMKDLKLSKKSRADTQAKCIRVAADYENSQRGRTEEMTVIEQALQVLTDAKGAGVKQTYSFLQVKMGSSGRADMDAIKKIIRNLAKQHHSPMFSQLASKISAVMSYGTRDGADPFAKVKGLLRALMTKLQKQARDEATEHQFCTGEMAKTKAKQDELNSDIAQLKTKIDTAVASSVALKQEVKEFQAESSDIRKRQALMDSARKTANKAYLVSKADLQQGIDASRQALGILRNYYGNKKTSALLQEDEASGDESGDLDEQPAVPTKHKKDTGAGSGIIGILEVAMSDMANQLAQVEATETDESATYGEQTQVNNVLLKEKEKAIEYKVSEYKSTDKDVADMTSDRDSQKTELSAINEYDKKLKERCVAKPMAYKERQRRREAEKQGLRKALKIINTQAAAR